MKHKTVFFLSNFYSPQTLENNTMATREAKKNNNTTYT